MNQIVNAQNKEIEDIKQQLDILSDLIIEQTINLLESHFINQDDNQFMLLATKAKAYKHGIILKKFQIQIEKKFIKNKINFTTIQTVIFHQLKDIKSL